MAHPLYILVKERIIDEYDTHKRINTTELAAPYPEAGFAFPK